MPASRALSSWQDLIEESRVDYSAESLIESGDTSILHRVFHARSMERRNQSIGGMEQVIIIRQDRGLVWVLMPALMLYLEQSLEDGMEQIGFQNGMDIRKKDLGSEVIDGNRTTKRAVTATKNGVTGFEGTTWTTDDGIMVQVTGTTIEGRRRSSFRMRLRNIKVGPQDPALFDVPEGFRKIELPRAVGSIGQGPSARPAR